MEPEPAAGSGLDDLYRTIAVQTTVRLAGSNIIGAAVVFSYLSYVVPLGGAQAVPSIVYLYVLLGYATLATPIVIVAGLRATRTIEQWIEADRDPTPEEKIAVLAQPYIQTRYSFRAWIGAAVVFTAYSLTQGVGVFDCFRIALGALLGGLTTSAFCFLLVERMHRPAFAAALSDGVLPERHGIQIRSRLLLMWMLGSGVPFVGIILAPFGRENATRGQIVAPIVVLAVIGLVVGLLVTTISARSVTDPLDEVRDGLELVIAGDLSASIPVDDGGELGALQAGYNRLLVGLRERDRLADLFGRHVGVDVAKKALEDGVQLGGEVRQVSVLFVDLIGSTGLALSRPATEVVELLNAFFGVIVTIIEENHGTVSRFDGDGALCVFGALQADELHPTNVLKAARELSIGLRVLGAKYPEIQAGIGVSTGSVVAGNIGARQRFEYTVIGDAANEASRLTDLAKGSTGRLLASSKSVHAAIAIEQQNWEYVGSVALRGRNELTETYEPAGSTAPDPTEAG